MPHRTSDTTPPVACERCEETTDQLESARHENMMLVGLLHEIALSGVEHDDPRVGYVTVQVDRGTWDAVRKVGK